MSAADHWKQGAERAEREALLEELAIVEARVEQLTAALEEILDHDAQGHIAIEDCLRLIYDTARAVLVGDTE